MHDDSFSSGSLDLQTLENQPSGVRTSKTFSEELIKISISSIEIILFKFSITHMAFYKDTMAYFNN